MTSSIFIQYIYRRHKGSVLNLSLCHMPWCHSGSVVVILHMPLLSVWPYLLLLLFWIIHSAPLGLTRWCVCWVIKFGRQEHYYTARRFWLSPQHQWSSWWAHHSSTTFKFPFNCFALLLDQQTQPTSDVLQSLQKGRATVKQDGEVGGCRHANAFKLNEFYKRHIFPNRFFSTFKRR